MANVAVVGAQWGDEGKGKIVDWLSERAEVVVRFQGGHNAGHTLVVGNIEYKLSLLPSGVVRGKLSIIGNGVVVDPWALLAEIATMRGKGLDITPQNLKLADNAALILPSHGALDRAREEFHVGNLYFNRKCTGAMVGAHPFGGFNMSGTDSKAGGPDYLLLFTQAKSVAEKIGHATPAQEKQSDQMGM